MTESKFKIQTTLRARNESLDIEISGKVFRIIFGKVLEKVLSKNFVKRKKVRRAFLRWLFAAEGNIAINSQQNYIVCIQYCLHYNEDVLASLIKKSLDLERITYTEIKQERDASRTIQMTSWTNYHKLWKIDLFRLNVRKEYRFLKKLVVTKFSCKISERVKQKVLSVKYFSDRQLALFAGMQPSVLCDLIGNKREYFDIEHLINLTRIASVPIKELKRSVLDFRIKGITPVYDKEFIDFVFDLKRFSI